MDKKQLFFLVIPIIAFFFGYFGFYYFYRPVKIKMPHLVGLALSDALTVATSVECVLSEHSEIISEQYRIPTIIAQDPASFNEIKIGQTVFVTVGKPPLLKQIPSFIGKTESEIQVLAEQYSLYVHVKKVFYQGLRNFCCGQFPQAGLLLSDQFITVYIAKEPDNRFIMPLLIGHTYHDAKHFLMQYGIVLRANGLVQKETQYSIFKQFPPFGSLIHIKQGFVVDVQVINQFQ